VIDPVLDAAPADPRHAEPREDEQRECAACADVRAQLEQRAAGHGTVEEIREAIVVLESYRRRGLKMGQKIRVDGRWLCPRCTPDDQAPPGLRAPNREERRWAARQARRRR
jgi:hypothetical protein